MGRVENDIGIDGFDLSMNLLRVFVERLDIFGFLFDIIVGDIDFGVVDELSIDLELNGFDVFKFRGKEMYRIKLDIFMLLVGGISVYVLVVDLW